MRVFLLEHLLTIASFLLAVFYIARITKRGQKPAGAVAWVMAIVLIPYVAVPLYFLIGGRKLSRVARRKGPLTGEGFGADPFAAEEPRCNAERLLIAAGMPNTRRDNIIVLHHNGETAYTVLMEMLEEATSSIHAMTFILGKDEVGRSIVEVLARKAAEGVEVRFLLDSLGCIKTSRRFVEPLREAGGKVGIFLPMLPLRRKWSANLRNHRKIVVCDGIAALVGGMNLANEYMGPRPEKKRFLDSAVFLRGPAVSDIEDIFISDWHYATDEWVLAPPKPEPSGIKGHASVQVMASGPDAKDDMLQDALLTAAMEARERIWIVTPYFLPDEVILKVLGVQARMGRDVRVVVPYKSNHLIADLARGPAIRHLMAAGGKIYAYDRAMVHAKALVFDNTLAITGSPNLDMRSLYLNFEIALLHYGGIEVAQTANWMEELMADSRSVYEVPYSPLREWVENLSFLVSPLL